MSLHFSFTGKTVRGRTTQSSKRPIHEHHHSGRSPLPVPQRRAVSEQAAVFPAHPRPDAPEEEELQFELAGPRSKLFFDPQQTRAGIVTCGGLCPGLKQRDPFPVSGTSITATA